MNKDTEFALLTAAHDKAWESVVFADRLRTNFMHIAETPEISALFMKMWEAESAYRDALFDAWRGATK